MHESDSVDKMDHFLRPQCNYNVFTRRRASEDYKRSIQRQVLDEVLKNNVQAKSEN